MLANEQFQSAVTSVINQLKLLQLQGNGAKNVTYLLSRDLLESSSKYFGLERAALEFLKSEKVIKETKRDELVIGEEGDTNYAAYVSVKLKILQQLDLYLETYLQGVAQSTAHKLIFRLTSGELSYVESNGAKISVTFKPGTIQYQVICNILSGLGKFLPYEDCVRNVEGKRIHSDTDEEDKTRNALKSIRGQFRKNGLSNVNVETIFSTSYGVAVTMPFTIIP